jgi:hypothetical protein
MNKTRLGVEWLEVRENPSGLDPIDPDCPPSPPPRPPMWPRRLPWAFRSPRRTNPAFLLSSRSLFFFATPEFHRGCDRSLVLHEIFAG